MSLIQKKKIADFSVQCYQNNAFHAVTKADVLGKWSVFFFYPADFTFVCPTELEDLANLYDKFQAIGCEVYSVSCDTHFVHKAWHDASERIQKIQYPMLLIPHIVWQRILRSTSKPTAWRSGAASLSTPRGKSWPMRSTPAMWAGTPTNCCGRYRRASSWRSTETRCARRSGSPAPRP